MPASSPSVFNLVFPIANAMAMTPAEAAAFVQRMINGGRPEKRRRRTDPSGTSSDGGQAAALTTTVAEALTTVEADVAGAIVDPDSEDVTAVTNMMAGHLIGPAYVALPVGLPAVADTWPPRPLGTSPVEHSPAVPPVPEWWPVAPTGPAPPALPVPAGSPSGSLPALPNDFHPGLIEWLGTAPPALTNYANVLLASYAGSGPGTLTIGPPMASAAAADCLDAAGTEPPAAVFVVAPTAIAPTPTVCPDSVAPASVLTDAPAESAAAPALAPAEGTGAPWPLESA